MSDKFAKMMFFTCRNIKFILIKTKYYRQNLFEKIKIIIQKTEKKLEIVFLEICRQSQMPAW